MGTNHEGTKARRNQTERRRDGETERLGALSFSSALDLSFFFVASCVRGESIRRKLRGHLCVSAVALVLFSCCHRAQALNVWVNEVGFEPNAPKMVRVERTSDSAGGGTFTVKRAS